MLYRSFLLLACLLSSGKAMAIHPYLQGTNLSSGNVSVVASAAPPGFMK